MAAAEAPAEQLAGVAKRSRHIADQYLADRAAADGRGHPEREQAVEVEPPPQADGDTEIANATMPMRSATEMISRRLTAACYRAPRGAPLQGIPEPGKPLTLPPDLPRTGEPAFPVRPEMRGSTSSPRTGMRLTTNGSGGSLRVRFALSVSKGATAERHGGGWSDGRHHEQDSDR